MIENAIEEPAPAVARSLGARVGKGILRLAMIAFFATMVTLILNKSSSRMAASGQLAGFGSGMLHGALMPGAFPSLLLGRDVVIYSPTNNGIPYKLGYTFGVNACGAVFFGWTFWRVNRWRKKR